MEQYIITMNFKNVDNEKLELKFNDIKTDITREELEAFANKILEKNAVKYKGKHLVEYVNSKLEKITTEII